MDNNNTIATPNTFVLSFSNWIFKLLRNPRIDSKESIPLAHVAWRAVITALFLLGS